MIRLLAVDIDGTLLDGRGRLPDAHRDALVDAVDAGIDVALVTGRTFHFARPIADLLPIPLTLVVNNGAVVKRKTGETEIRNVLSRDAAQIVLAETRHLEDSVAVVFDRPDERQIVFERMDWSHPHRRGYYEKNKAFISHTPALVSEVLADDPIQVMFNGSVEPMRALAQALRSLPVADRISVAVTEYELRDFSLVDVNAAGCSKGTTLARWASSRGVTRDEVMAVGDNLNDVDMLDFAGVVMKCDRRAQVARAASDWHERRTRPRRRHPTARWGLTGCRRLFLGASRSVFRPVLRRRSTRGRGVVRLEDHRESTVRSHVKLRAEPYEIRPRTTPGVPTRKSDSRVTTPSTAPSDRSRRTVRGHHATTSDCATIGGIQRARPGRNGHADFRPPV